MIQCVVLEFTSEGEPTLPANRSLESSPFVFGVVAALMKIVFHVVLDEHVDRVVVSDAPRDFDPREADRVLMFKYCRISLFSRIWVAFSPKCL